ncbi:hypothetical protein RFI_09686 [Reticulomyxa filosa]|uniref:Kelch motif family protein n=1 Tax=Reticulomyxa filosa TaxID=46433 RepID=X6NP39_RETFI|nr:hypothetical protein RFI_09686 [Reticulomyxa filosa]|eukprot:ETO27444.1 hypothetical protein RFI_09686 [Reticulomyxa filosa]
MARQRFKMLPSLPVSLSRGQCVVYKKELLLCGGFLVRECYSYDTVKNQYKPICSYPKGITSRGHCVVANVRNSNSDNKNDNTPNGITLLSFGGVDKYQPKHALVMQYKSVWDNDNAITYKSTKPFNEWIPLTDEHNNPIQIGIREDNYIGARSLIGGSNNHLLFITYPPKDIAVFNLNNFQCIKRSTLPIENWIGYHCFILGRQKNEMLLFCKKTGLSIEYNEDTNAFQFHHLSVCNHIANLGDYAYVRINDNDVLFFGGEITMGWGRTNEVHRYSIGENKWIAFRYIMPVQLSSCTAVLAEDSTCVHIIGGHDGQRSLDIHMQTHINEWLVKEQMQEKPSSEQSNTDVSVKVFICL